MTHAPSLPRPPLDPRTLPGRTVDLERLDPARHGADLWQSIGADPALWGGTPTGPFDDEAAFMEWQLARAKREDAVLLAIVDKRGDRPRAAGLFFLIHMEPAMGAAELGLVYGPALSRQVGGTEAFFLVARYIFEASGYRRLAWYCNDTNEPSKRAAERFGFSREGLLRQSMWVKGANWDSAVYSMLDREWPAIGARLTAYLAPENFSPDGSQIKPLSAFTRA